MNNSTGISWAQATWNPVTGCDKVSEGCDNCYAEALTKKYPKNWPDGFAVVLHPDRLNQPAKVKQGKRIFVNSMSDLFHPKVTDEFLTRIWQTMLDHPRHTYLTLTKRPQPMARRILQLGLPVPDHIWLGTSIESQQYAEHRAEALLRTPGKVRWVSAEPLIGPLDLSEWLGPDLINWVVVGAESGKRRRQMKAEWATGLRDQCQAVEVPFFYKQGSAYRSGQYDKLENVRHHKFPTHPQYHDRPHNEDAVDRRAEENQKHFEAYQAELAARR